MLWNRTSRTMLLVVATVLAGTSCKEASREGGCDPTDPLCSTGPEVANVEITSPVDTVMAVGRDVQLTATAIDAAGSTVSTTFSWESSNPSAATVSAGLVSALAAGTANIRATTPNDVSGQLRMRAVDADLAGVSTTLTDPFAQSLAAALDASTQSQVAALVSTCAGHVVTGHVRAIDECLVDLLGTGAANENDTALLAVLALYFEHARRQLQL